MFFLTESREKFCEGAQKNAPRASWGDWQNFLSREVPQTAAWEGSLAYGF
jgi:hypothetical protein